MFRTPSPDEIPAGYHWEESTSPFVNFIGPTYHKKATGSDGQPQHWRAIRIEEHQTNTWRFGHGALIAGLAELATGSAAYQAGGPPVVIVELVTQYIAAPKLGSLLEVCGTLVHATRSMRFTRCIATADDQVIFTASGVHKVIKG